MLAKKKKYCSAFELQLTIEEGRITRQAGRGRGGSRASFTDCDITGARCSRRDRTVCVARSRLGVVVTFPNLFFFCLFG